MRQQTWDCKSEPQREDVNRQSVVECVITWLKDVLMDSEGGEKQGCGFQHAHQMGFIYEEI